MILTDESASNAARTGWTNGLPFLLAELLCRGRWLAVRASFRVSGDSDCLSLH